MAVLAGDALGMELDSMDRQRLVVEALDRPVLGARIDDQAGGEALRGQGQRMIASRGEGGGEAGEDPAAVMVDRRDLAVHDPRRARDPPAEMLPDRLMAEADA